MRHVDVWLRAEVGMEREPHQSAFAVLGDFRNLTNGRALSGRRVHARDASTAFSDPDLTVRAPGDVPRCHQTGDDRLDLEPGDGHGWLRGGVVRARLADREERDGREVRTGRPEEQRTWLASRVGLRARPTAAAIRRCDAGERRGASTQDSRKSSAGVCVVSHHGRGVSSQAMRLPNVLCASHQCDVCRSGASKSRPRATSLGRS